MHLFFLGLCAAFAASAPVQPQATLDDVEVSTDQVVFVLDHPVKEKIQRLEKPDRLVIDLPGAFSALAQGVFDGRGHFLTQARSAQSEAAAGAVRLVLELKVPAAYQARWEGGRLTVRLMEPPAVSSPTVKAQPAAAAAAAPKPMPAKPAPKPAVPKARSRGFLVQAGAFSKKETAMSFKEEIEPAVPGWVVSTTTVKSAVLYRLRAGPFASRAEAEAAVKKLAAMGEKAVILPAP